MVVIFKAMKRQRLTSSGHRRYHLAWYFVIFGDGDRFEGRIQKGYIRY